MALDTKLRRKSALNVRLKFLRVLPDPDGTIETEDRYTVAGYYSGIIAQVPAQLAQVPNFAVGFDSGTHQYDISAYFSGATSYSIAPAVEAGWTFNTSSGLLTIDTDDASTFGPYTVTATNAHGNTDSNAFTVKVSQASIPISRLGPRGRLRIGLSHGHLRK